MSEESLTETIEGKPFSAALESEYRQSIQWSDRRTNFYALIIALPLYSLYALIDAITLTYPNEGIAIRLAAAAIAALPVIAMRWSSLRDRHDLLTAASVVAMGAGINLIIGRDPSLGHNYYVALIQGGIFVSFLVRMSFNQSILVLASFLLGFLLAVVGKSPREDALLQSFILVTMFSMCAFGIHLTQMLRRRDFLKSKTIASQNEKLNEMLKEVRLDNARKVAAMNLLVHFVKTPIHQIVGFTDIITRAIEQGAHEKAEETLESARFIKTASRELNQNVSSLLAYYRLDERRNDGPTDLIELDTLIRDLIEHLPERAKTKFSGEKIAIVNRHAVASAAIKALVDYYSAEDGPAIRIEARLDRSADGAVLCVLDDQPLLSAEDFARATKPLDRFDHYLTANGSSMPMALRTVARAAEIGGGRLSWRDANGRNCFTLSLKDYAGAHADALSIVA